MKFIVLLLFLLLLPFNSYSYKIDLQTGISIPYNYIKNYYNSSFTLKIACWLPSSLNHINVLISYSIVPLSNDYSTLIIHNSGIGVNFNYKILSRFLPYINILSGISLEYLDNQSTSQNLQNFDPSLNIDIGNIFFIRKKIFLIIEGSYLLILQKSQLEASHNGEIFYITGGVGLSI